jgi:hypothetical protein
MREILNTNITEMKLSELPCGNKFIYNGRDYTKRSRYRSTYQDENNKTYYKTFNKHVLVLVKESEINWGS